MPMTSGTSTETTEDKSINFQMFKMFIDVVPRFDGTPSVLNDFLSACDELVLTYGSRENPVQDRFVLRAIKNKLYGRAQVAIASRLELATWDEVRAVLVNTYSDSRDLPTLQAELMQLNIDNQRETLAAFGDKIISYQSLLMSKLKQSSMTLDAKHAMS